MTILIMNRMKLIVVPPETAKASDKEGNDNILNKTMFQ